MMPAKNCLYCFVLFAAFLMAVPSHAQVSVNVPIGHWSYGAVEKLTSLGFVRSSMPGTKPFTRLEMARLTREADSSFEGYLHTNPGASPGGHTEIIRGILERLKTEFGAELDELRGTSGVSTYIKPVEDMYVRYLGSNNDFTLENDKGETYADGANLRAGFSSHGVIARHLAWYINPEYRYSKEQFSGDDNDLTILEGYGKLQFFNLELEAGRDSLWWGQGYHGSLILTDNAKPFDLIKLSNPRPVVLPWIFKYLGLFKVAAFWTQLEGNRYIPDAELMGLRINLKPFPFLDIGASRTIMLGGEGPEAPKGVSELSGRDWIRVLSGRNIAGELDTNQIAGVDARLHFCSLDRWIPVLKSLDLWGELYGEDQAGKFPSRNGYVVGMKLGDILLTGRTDFILEYATNVVAKHPGYWYNHHVYRTGYRYEGRVMGHDMGGEAREIFARLEHYLAPDLVLGLDYNNQERGAQHPVQENRERYDLDLTWYRSAHLFLQGGYRFESIDNLDNVQSADQDNRILSLSMTYSF